MIFIARIADERILSALLDGGSVRKASEIAGCSVGTIRNRLSDPTFKARFQAAKSEILTETCTTLTANLSAAVEALANIIRDDETPVTSRIQASDSLLRHGLRYIEQGEILHRLEVLEELQKEGADL